MRGVLVASLLGSLAMFFMVHHGPTMLAKTCMFRPADMNIVDGPLTLSSKIYTQIPMYYVNLDRSKERREHMERVFGPWGSLRRIQAVDASNSTLVAREVNLHDMDVEDYAEEVSSSTKGEVALTASHMRAVRAALEEDKDIMLLLEDDASEILSPYWTLSLEEVVNAADARSPNWEIIQLQSNFKDPANYDAWKYDEDAPLLRQRDDRVAWGCGAQLISRKGMEKLVDLFVFDNKVDCLPTLKKEKKMKCIPDDFYWRLKNIESYIMVPPMFGQMMNEGSTGVRLKLTKNIAGNDHYPLHFRSYHHSLRSSVEAFEAYNARWELGEGVEMPYMNEQWGLEMKSNLKSLRGIRKS